MSLFLANSFDEIFCRFCEKLQTINGLNPLPAAIVTAEISDLDFLKKKLVENDILIANCKFFTLRLLAEELTKVSDEKQKKQKKQKIATREDLAMICRHLVEPMPNCGEKSLLESDIYGFLQAMDDIIFNDYGFYIFNNQRLISVARAFHLAIKNNNIARPIDHLNDQIADICKNNRKMFQQMMFYGFQSTHIDKLGLINALKILAIDSSFFCLDDGNDNREFFWLEMLEKSFGDVQYIHTHEANRKQCTKITRAETQLAEALAVLDEVEKIISSNEMAHIGIVAPHQNCPVATIIGNFLADKRIPHYSTLPNFGQLDKESSILLGWTTFQQDLSVTSLVAFMRQLLANHKLEFDRFNKVLGEFSKAFDHTFSKNCKTLLAVISQDNSSESIDFFKKYPLLADRATFLDFFKRTEEVFPKVIAAEDVAIAMAFKEQITRANFCIRLKASIMNKKCQSNARLKNNAKIWIITSQQAEKYAFSHGFILSANRQSWLTDHENVFLGNEAKNGINPLDRKITTAKTITARKKYFLDNLQRLAPNIFITDHNKNLLSDSAPTHIFESNSDEPQLKNPSATYYSELIYGAQPKPSPVQLDQLKQIYNLRRNETIKFGEYDYSLNGKQLGKFIIPCKALERATTHPVDVWNETILGAKNTQHFDPDIDTIRRMVGTLVHNLLDFSFARNVPQKVPGNEMFHKILKARFFGIYNRIKASAGAISPLYENILKDSLHIALKLANNVSKIGQNKWFLSEYAISGQVTVSESLTINTQGRIDLIIINSPSFPSSANHCEPIIIDYKTGNNEPLAPTKFGKIDNFSGEINLTGLQLILYALALESLGCQNPALITLAENFTEEDIFTNIHSLNEFSNINTDPVIRAIKNVAILGIFGQQRYNKFLNNKYKQIAPIQIPNDIINRRAAL
ncbi:MAG: PD-(D/E)XK nuclease family protein [Puniceicoccales bacterium]|jgi:hypothetical protein|nr:PD-(D/E)XK nuclease family protein [Puniceicoccales bacterium]